MPLYRGKDIAFYISTEDATYGINSTGGGDLSANAAGNFIAKLAVSLATATQLTNVTALEFSPNKEKETIEYLGKNLDDYITVRENGEISISKLVTSHGFAQLIRVANNGVDGNALNEYDEIKGTGHGFRIFIVIKSSNIVYTFRNCCLINYTPSIGANKTDQETLVFRSALIEVGTGGFFTATTAGEL